MIRSLFLFLLLPCLAHAQPIAIGYKYTADEIAKARSLVSTDKDAPTGISVGGQYTTLELEKAKEVIANSQPKVLKLEVGEFEVIEPAASVTSPLLWIVQDETICQRIDIKPGQPFGVWMKRRGDAAAKYHAFDAKPVGWILLIGVKQGQSITHIVRNGASDKEAPAIVDKLDVTVGTPVPPKPPTPPVPVDVWSKDGLRVMLLFESGNNTMTSTQVAAVNSTHTREYLTRKCVKVNGQPEWRYWDKDTDISRESEIWKDALERWRKAGSKVPFLLISNGKDTDYAGDVPANLEQMAELLKKYGGQ